MTLSPWLSLKRVHATPMRLHKLRRDLAPHLSGREIKRVVVAIRLASCDNLKKVAGATNFCSLLVNSLEMTDVPAFCTTADLKKVAGAANFCSLLINCSR
jgi:hypothetical protein